MKHKKFLQGVMLVMGLWSILQVSAESQIAAAIPAPDALVWRGEEQWMLRLAEEAGRMRIGFVQTPMADYLLTGSLTLDDAELGITGSGRWRAGKLILDLSISGGVRDLVPDAEKRALFDGKSQPMTLDSAGFAMMRIELDGNTLNGVSQQYQTNIVTGNRVQGPVYRGGEVKYLKSH